MSISDANIYVVKCQSNAGEKHAYKTETHSVESHIFCLNTLMSESLLSRCFPAADFRGVLS